MTKLIDLSADYLVDIPKKSGLPACMDHASITHVPCTECQLCPRVTEHLSCVREIPDGSALPDASRLRARTLRKMQYLCSRVHQIAYWPDYFDPNYQLNGETYKNFAWNTQWVIGDSSGHDLTIWLSSNGLPSGTVLDPRDVTLPYTTIRTVAIQPGDLIEFPVPTSNDAWTQSILSLKMKCYTQRVVINEDNTVTVTVDQDVTNVCNPGIIAEVSKNPVFYVARNWRRVEHEKWVRVFASDGVRERCVHCVRDYSDSEWRAPTGTATDGDGHVWLCDARVSAPSGLEDFTAACAQTSCDHYARGDVFTQRDDLSGYLAQLWEGVSTRINNTTHKIAMVDAPGLRTLYGGETLELPGGAELRNDIRFLTDGLLCGAKTVATDIDGNETLGAVHGMYWDDNAIWTLFDRDAPATWPPDGVITAGDDNDALHAAWNDTTDKYNTHRQGGYRSGIELIRDSGAHAGRHNAYHTRLVDAGDIVYCPGITATESAVRDMATWIVCAEPETINGVEYPAHLIIKPLRQATKLTQTVTVGQIYRAAASGDDEIEIEIEPATHYVRWYELGEIHQREFCFGGNFVSAPSWMRIHGYEDGQPALGGAALAACGDAVRIDFTGDLEWLSGYHMTIVRAEPFAGTARGTAPDAQAQVYAPNPETWGNCCDKIWCLDPTGWWRDHAGDMAGLAITLRRGYAIAHGALTLSVMPWGGTVWEALTYGLWLPCDGRVYLTESNMTRLREFAGPFCLRCA